MPLQPPSCSERGARQLRMGPRAAVLRRGAAAPVGWPFAMSASVCWSSTSMKALERVVEDLIHAARRLRPRPLAPSSISTCVTSVARTTSPMRIALAGRASRTPPLRPRTASIRLRACQQVDDLEDVLRRDLQALRELRHLDQAVVRACAVDQDADGVAGGFGQTHR